MKTFREILSKKSIYPFEATPQVNKHLEDEVIKAMITWLRSNQNEYSYSGWQDAIDDLVTMLQKEQFATSKISSK